MNEIQLFVQTQDFFTLNFQQGKETVCLDKKLNFIHFNTNIDELSCF